MGIFGTGSGRDPKGNEKTANEARTKAADLRAEVLLDGDGGKGDADKLGVAKGLDKLADGIDPE